MILEPIGSNALANNIGMDISFETPPLNNIEFSTFISQGLNEVNMNVVKADNLLQAKALEESVSSHELMIAMEQAKLSLQLTIEIRNKALEGYQEIMRMQL